MFSNERPQRILLEGFFHFLADGLASALRGNGTWTLVAVTVPVTRGDVHSPSHHGFPEMEADIWGKVCACMGESTLSDSSETKHSSAAGIWELLFRGEDSLECPGKLCLSIHPVDTFMPGCYFIVRMTDWQLTMLDSLQISMDYSLCS